MKSKLYFLLVFLWFGGTVLSAQDTLYNWARSGLNIRTEPSKKGAVVGVIPFRAIVDLVDRNSKFNDDLFLTDLLYDLKKKEFHDFWLDGNWVLVRYQGVEGYVFDGYLSKLPPLEEIDVDGIYYTESWERYCARNFTAVDSTLVSYGPESTRKTIWYENGVLYERRMSVGMDRLVFVFPNSSLRDGLAVFLLGFDTPAFQNRRKDSLLCVRNRGWNHLSFSVNEATGRRYDIQVYGSVLIVSIFMSC